MQLLFKQIIPVNMDRYTYQLAYVRNILPYTLFTRVFLPPLSRRTFLITQQPAIMPQSQDMYSRCQRLSTVIVVENEVGGRWMVLFNGFIDFSSCC